MEEKPILILEKRAEPRTHKMIIPKRFIEKNGFIFKMEVYNEKLIITPIKEGE